MADWEYVDDEALPPVKGTTEKWEYVDDVDPAISKQTLNDAAGNVNTPPSQPHPAPKISFVGSGLLNAAQGINDRVQEDGGWGLAPETRQALGAGGPLKVLRPLTDLPANIADLGYRGLQAGQGAIGEVGDALARATGLDKLLAHDGHDFRAGSLAVDLINGLPIAAEGAGGLRPMSLHEFSAPIGDTLAPAARAALNAQADELFHGTPDRAPATRAEMDAWAKQNGMSPFGSELDDALARRDNAGKYEYVDDQGEAVPHSPEYPQIKTGELGASDNRPYTPEEQAMADKLNADKTAFKPSTDPTAEDLFTPKKPSTPQEFEAGLQKSAQDFLANKKAETPAPTEQPFSEAEARVKENASALDEKASEIKSNWTNAPDHEVFSSLDDISDPKVREAAKAEGADEHPAFFGPDGKIYLNANKLTPDEVAPAVFHEALGHYGLAQKFRGDLDNVLQAMYDSNQGKYRIAADNWLKENPDAYGGKATPVRAMEEVLAEESENGKINASVFDRLKNVIKRKSREMGLNLEYSDREIKSILSDVHRQVTNGVKGEASPSGIRTMYIGQNAKDLQKEDRFGMPTRADHVFDFQDDVDLQHAEGRYDPVELRDRYGLHLGPEGGLRSEITDHEAKIKHEVDRNTVPSGERLPLSDVLHHPELFRNYPEFKDMEITRTPASMDFDKGIQGWTTKDGINITPYAKDPLSTILHEVQHKIQDKEGWLSGGSTDNVLKSMTPNQLARLHSEAVKHYEKEAAVSEGHLNEVSNRLDFVATKLADDEVASLVERLDAAEKEVDRAMAAKKTDSSVKVTPAMDARRDIQRELVKKLFDKDNYLKLDSLESRQYHDILRASKDNYAGLAKLHDEYGNAAGFHRKMLDAAKAKIDALNNANDIHAFGKAIPSDLAFKAYQNMFGEIEARDTQARRDLTPDQRRAVLPYSNANDVDVGDLVKTRQPGGPAMSADKPTDIKPMRKRREDVRAGVNFEHVDSLHDLTALATELEKSYKPSAPETWAETKAKAREYLLDANKLAKGLGVRDAAAKIHAYGMLNAQAMDDLAGVWKEIDEKGGRPTADMQAKAAQYSAKLAAVRAGFLHDQTELARAMRAMAIMKTTAGKSEEYLRLLNEHGGEAAVFSDPGMFLKFMNEYSALVKKGDVSGAHGLLAKPKDFFSKAMDVFTNVANVPRSMMASFDLSAPFRQGFFMIGSKNFYRAWGPMLKSFASKYYYEGLMHDIEHGPAFPLMMKAGLHLGELGKDLSKREEQFMSPLAEKIPGIGQGIKMSERAYTAFLNKLRADSFNQLVVRSNKLGIDFDKDPKALKDIARFVNAATGRGDLGGFNQAAASLATIFFSPRLMASRVQLLNPMFYAKLSPVVRREAIKGLVSAGIVATTVASLAHMGGADVETDPRSSDFAKLRFGDTRYDILGGFGQYVTLGARLATNESKSLRGEVTSLDGQDFPFKTREDTVYEFARNKASPMASLLLDYWRGKDVVGNEFEVTQPDSQNAIIKRIIPLAAQDTYDVMKEYGVGQGAIRSIPTFFGVGLQNFNPDDNVMKYKPPSHNFSVDGQKVSLQGSDYDTYRSATKDMFEKGMQALSSSPGWAKADHETKKAAIRELNKEVREEARTSLLSSGKIKLPENLQKGNK